MKITQQTPQWVRSSIVLGVAAAFIMRTWKIEGKEGPFILLLALVILLFPEFLIPSLRSWIEIWRKKK